MVDVAGDVTIRGGEFGGIGGRIRILGGELEATQLRLAPSFTYGGAPVLIGGGVIDADVVVDAGYIEVWSLLTVDGDFTQSSAGTLVLSLGLSTDDVLVSDLIGITGTPSFAGILRLGLNDGAADRLALNDTFDLLDFTGTPGGAGFTLSFDALPNGWSWDTSNLYVDGTVTVIPEPGTMAAVGVGLLVFGGTRGRGRGRGRIVC